MNVTVEKQKVEIDGLPIRYLAAGEGPPLVLLHGAGDNALVLVDSAGLGRAVNPAFTSVNVPYLSEAAIPFWRTPVGAYQRTWGRAALLFARPANAPRQWLAEQCRLTRSPGYLGAHLSVLRAQI